MRRRRSGRLWMTIWGIDYGWWLQPMPVDLPTISSEMVKRDGRKIIPRGNSRQIIPSPGQAGDGKGNKRVVRWVIFGSLLSFETYDGRLLVIRHPRQHLRCAVRPNGDSRFGGCNMHSNPLPLRRLYSALLCGELPVATPSHSPKTRMVLMQPLQIGILYTHFCCLHTRNVSERRRCRRTQ